MIGGTELAHLTDLQLAKYLQYMIVLDNKEFDIEELGKYCVVVSGQSENVISNGQPVHFS